MTFQQIKVGASVILTRKSISYNYYFHDSMSSSMSKYDFYQIKLGTCVIPHFQWIWNGKSFMVFWSWFKVTFKVNFKVKFLNILFSINTKSNLFLVWFWLHIILMIQGQLQNWKVNFSEGQNVKIYNILMIKGDLRCENVSFKVKWPKYDF